MKISKHFSLPLLGFIAGAFVTTTAYSAVFPQDFLGYPGDEQTVERTVTLSNGTRVINVKHNETVKFVDPANGDSFVWRFYSPLHAFNLGLIPSAKGSNMQAVTVYVAQPPLTN